MFASHILSSRHVEWGGATEARAFSLDTSSEVDFEL